MKKALLVAGLAYTAIHRLGRTAGATRTERTASLPGDDIVEKPLLLTTHAITIDAPPERVWPWLVQMGWGRGGWYTARWVDQLLFPANGPSADRIVPELQHTRIGDFIPDGTRQTGAGFVVEALEPARHLVLHSTTHLPPGWAERFGAWIDWTWAFALEPIDDTHTRFLFRCRGRVGPRWLAAAYWLAIIPADFVMSRQMMRGLRTRAETRSDHSSRGVASCANAGRRPGAEVPNRIRALRPYPPRRVPTRMPACSFRAPCATTGSCRSSLYWPSPSS